MEEQFIKRGGRTHARVILWSIFGREIRDSEELIRYPLYGVEDIKSDLRYGRIARERLFGPGQAGSALYDSLFAMQDITDPYSEDFWRTNNTAELGFDPLNKFHRSIIKQGISSVRLPGVREEVIQEEYRNGGVVTKTVPALDFEEWVESIEKLAETREEYGEFILNVNGWTLPRDAGPFLQALIDWTFGSGSVYKIDGTSIRNSIPLIRVT